MPSTLASLVTEALRPGPLAAPGIFATIRNEPSQSPEPTVGSFFWTLDHLVAGGAVAMETDGSGGSAYRLLASTARVHSESRGGTGSPEPADEMPLRRLPNRSTERAAGTLAVRGSLGIATRRLSLRARISLQATWSSQR